MIESWLLAPTIGPDRQLEPKRITDGVENVYVDVPNHGGFWVTRFIGKDVRREFVESICEYLYGAVYDWQVSSLAQQ